MSKSREPEFDIIKGIAIFLVVMGHVLLNMTPADSRPPLFYVISSVHMPLFFFISGWWAMKRNADDAVVRPSIGERAMRLLPSAVVVGALWFFFMPYTGLGNPLTSYSQMWTYGAKGGYWFPIVLFECVLLYRLLLALIGSRFTFVKACVAGAGLWLAVALLSYLLPASISDTLSLPSVRLHFPAFFVGVLAHRYSEIFRRMRTDKWSLAACIIVVGVGCLGFGNIGLIRCSGVVYIAYYQLFICALAVIAFAAVTKWVSGGTGRVAAIWSLLGRRSFAIYLLHYFFLFPGGAFGAVLEQCNYNIVPSAFVSASVAALVVCAVLVVDYIICLSSPLAFLLVGEKFIGSSAKQSV